MSTVEGTKEIEGSEGTYRDDHNLEHGNCEGDGAVGTECDSHELNHGYGDGDGAVSMLNGGRVRE